MFDRKLLANHEMRKKRGSYESQAQTLLAHTPGHQVQLLHCSSIDSSPTPLHQVPENVDSREPDQRTQAYDRHSSGSALPLDNKPAQVVPLDTTFVYPPRRFCTLRHFYINRVYLFM